MPTAAHPSAIPAPDLGLIESFPLRPIRSEAGLTEAIAMMRTPTACDLDEDEADYLDVLGTLMATNRLGDQRASNESKAGQLSDNC